MTIRAALRDILVLFGIIACGSVALVSRDIHLLIANSTPASGKINQLLDGGLDIEEQSRQAIRDGRVTIDDANKAAIDERVLLEKQTPLLMSDIHGVLLASQASVAGLQPVEASVRESLSGVTPMLNETTARIHAIAETQAAANKFLADFDASSAASLSQFNEASARMNTLFANPDVPVILHNVAGITGTSQHMLFTADQVESKLAACTLHPHFTCSIKSDLILGAQVGGYLLH
jgi:hypothetical protein